MVLFVFNLTFHFFSNHIVVGTELFAKNQLNNNMYLTQHSNFQSVWGAFTIMWKWQTGENWDGMMEQMAGRAVSQKNSISTILF